MSDDARRELTDEEQARIQVTRRDGGMCAWCGRALAAGETVWMERIAIDRVYGGRAASWRVPIGAECASPAFRAATEEMEPERCAGCGRGVYYQTGHRPRGVALCSKRCGSRYYTARKREAGR